MKWLKWHEGRSIGSLVLDKYNFWNPRVCICRSQTLSQPDERLKDWEFVVQPCETSVKLLLRFYSVFELVVWWVCGSDGMKGDRSQRVVLDHGISWHYGNAGQKQILLPRGTADRNADCWAPDCVSEQIWAPSEVQVWTSQIHKSTRSRCNV